MQSTWQSRTLADFIVLQRGMDLPHRLRRPGRYKVLSSGEASGSHDEGPVKGPGFVVGRATNIGRPTWSDDDYWPLNTVLYAKDFLGNDPKFAYYWFLQTDLTAYNSGSVQPMLNRNYIANVPINVPPIEQQRAIAATLGALDAKVDSNRRAKALIVDLAGLLYSDACGGRPRVASLGDVAEFHNRRRIPLSSQEREERVGPYPYYGATGVFGYVDDYLFDQILVLVGEDGSVVSENGTPVTQYIWGKAWINNHAHPLTGLGISNELLLVALRATDVRPIVTGAVQAKLSMGNLKSVPVRLPAPGPTQRHLEDQLNALFADFRRLEDESVTLAKLRDALLPELMAGRIRANAGSDPAELTHELEHA